MNGPSTPTGQTGHARLRPLNEPRPVRVRVDGHGMPVEIIPETRIREKREVRGRRAHAVIAQRETWRIDDEWWRAPLSRSYHTVVLESGRLVTLFRDLPTGDWFLQD